MEKKLFDSFSWNSDVSTGFAKSLPIVLFATYKFAFCSSKNNFKSRA